MRRAGVGKRRVGVGFVGAGGIARERLAPGLRAIPGVDLVSVATSSLASAEAAARDLGFRRAAGDWRAVANDGDVDAVVVATWPDLHAPATLAALDAGKHVLTCGRMAMDRIEAAAMLAATRARPERVAMLVPGAFSLWADRTIARTVSDGSIGELHTVRVSWSGGVFGSEPWRRLRRHSGNNVMALGIVYEAMVRWLGRATHVIARLELREPTMAGPDRAGVAVDVPDMVHALITFPGRVEAIIEMAADPRPEPNAAWFHGSEGTLRADFARRRLAIRRTDDDVDRWQRVTARAGERARWHVERDFIASIRDGAPVTLVDFESGWHGMAFTDAVHESARSGRRIEIPGTH